MGRNADGRLEVFALGPGGAYIAHRWQNVPSGGWSDWQQFGAGTDGPRPPGRRIDAFAVQPGGAELLERTQSVPSGGWGLWHHFGGPVGGLP